ncbi:MAG TPA: cupin domain-containing protein [Bryobacteraceae bacterium]|nr:cupin domain-containing protein [Bryobacteraceae bacterium]
MIPDRDDDAGLDLIFERIGDSVEPATPPSELKRRILARVAAYETLKPLADLRSDEGEWRNIGAPGVEMRSLFSDLRTGRSTMLIRMDPGARIPSHIHHDDEQCLVLEGDIGWGELVYRKGDFIVMGKDTTHPEIQSREGNLLLLVAGRNEFVL